MNVLSRLRDVTAAAWQDWTEQSRNPEQEVDAYLCAQQKHLEETKALYQQSVEQAIILRQQYSSAEELSARRYEQALLALKVGEEDVAKFALEEKRQAEAVSENTRALYEQCQNTILQLAEAAHNVQQELHAVRSKLQRERPNGSFDQSAGCTGNHKAD